MINIWKFLEIPFVYNLSQKLYRLGRRSFVENWLKEVLDPETNDIILDIGCGTGRCAQFFNCHYIGIDINTRYIEYAKRAFKKEFFCMDATALKFPDNMFDYVFSTFLFHHLDDKAVNLVIEEARRVCKPGGKIIILDPILPISKSNFIGRWFCKIDRGRFARTLENLIKLFSVYPFRESKYKLKKALPLEYTLFILKT